MKNWCPGNSFNTGHEQLHPNLVSTILTDDANSESGPSGIIGVCKHCRMMYFSEGVPGSDEPVDGSDGEGGLELDLERQDT